MRKIISVVLLAGVLGTVIFFSQGNSGNCLARYVQYQEGKCPPLADNCRCGLVRKQGKVCLFQVVFEADGSAVPGGRIYAATVECSEKCKNNDPPTSGEKAGEVILRGPRHPEIWSKLEILYTDLIAKSRAFQARYHGQQLMDPHKLRADEESIIAVEKRIALILLYQCVGYFYQAIPESIRIPFENFRFVLEPHSPQNAPMETNMQFGARLFVYRDCFFDIAYRPTPEIFCASILHEMYHWQQENYGAGSQEIENILYELACTEKMRWNSFYLWILNAEQSLTEYFNPQRDYWVPKFKKVWNRLDRAARKKVAGWAWSRGGVNDSTPEDPCMRLLMYSRQGWLSDIWETLFRATELRIIRPPLRSLYKRK